MMKLVLILLLMIFAGAPAWAAPDAACQEACVRQGNAWAYCTKACGQGGRRGNTDMLDQPGLPRNPAFDQLERDTRPDGRALPPVVDKKCLKDCQGKGYQYQLCVKQCSY